MKRGEKKERKKKEGASPGTARGRDEEKRGRACYPHTVDEAN